MLQVLGERAIISGKISSRPKSIANDSKSFENPVYPEKFATLASAENIGPTLLKQEVAAEMFVSRLNGSKLMRMNTIKKQTIL